MEKTEKEAIQKSIEYWGWLAETGKEKEDWPGVKKYGLESPYCFLCDYSRGESSQVYACPDCSYYKKFDHCNEDNAPFNKWFRAIKESTKKKYAGLFLEQLYSLRDKDG